MRPIVLALAMAGCASCATYGPQINTFDDVTSGLATFARKPVQDVAARFGVPHQQATFMGQQVFTWRTDRQWTRYVPTSTTTSGAVGEFGPWPGVPYSETTRSEQQVTSEWTCFMDVFVDKAGLVSNITIRGNQGACSNFMP